MYANKPLSASISTGAKLLYVPLLRLVFIYARYFHAVDKESMTNNRLEFVKVRELKAILFCLCQHSCPCLQIIINVHGLFAGNVVSCLVVYYTVCNQGIYL
jgi:hypothetical protein